MSEPDSETPSLTFLERNGWSLLRLWLLLMLLFFVIVGVVGSTKLIHDRLEADRRHEDRFKDANTGLGPAPDDSEKQVIVQTGIYVDRIPELLIPRSRWTVDFYIWFRWQNHGVDPGENFQIVDGEILRKTKIDGYDEGTRHFALYRVTAALTKAFDTRRYPQDDHVLTLRIEDTKYPHDALRYYPDVAGSRVSSRVAVPGFSIHHFQLVEKDHTYKTRRGDPRLDEDHQTKHSQLLMGLWIHRAGWELYIKLFLGTFASVMISFIAFLIHPSYNSPRIASGVGSFFATVASTYVLASHVPESNVVGLTDLVTGISLLTVFLSLLTSSISLGLVSRPRLKGLIPRFDRLSLAVFVLGYLLANLSFALSVRG